MGRVSHGLLRVLLVAVVLCAIAIPVLVNSVKVLAADPVTINSDNRSQSIDRNFQRKTFYANGRYWAFYSAFTGGMSFKSSTDGLTWSSVTAVRASVRGKDFTVCTDGIYVHYAYCDSSGFGNPIYYRRGLLNADGSITWSADEQTALNDATRLNAEMGICLDSNGYIYISSEQTETGTFVNRNVVTKNANKDGTWSTADGFPYVYYNDAASTINFSAIVALSNGKIVCTSVGKNSHLFFRAYTGSTWLDEVDYDKIYNSTFLGSGQSSMVVINDQVHCVVTLFSDKNVKHIIYDYATNAITHDETIDTNKPSYGIYTLTKDASNNLYLFFADGTTNHVYYQIRTGTTWDVSPTDWIDESSGTFLLNSNMTSIESVTTSNVGLMYNVGTLGSTPSLIKYILIDSLDPIIYDNPNYLDQDSGAFRLNELIPLVLMGMFILILLKVMVNSEFNIYMLLIVAIAIYVFYALLPSIQSMITGLLG